MQGIYTKILSTMYTPLFVFYAYNVHNSILLCRQPFFSVSTMSTVLQCRQFYNVDISTMSTLTVYNVDSGLFFI